LRRDTTNEEARALAESAVRNVTGADRKSADRSTISPTTAAAIAFTLVCWAAAFVGIRDVVRYLSPGSLAVTRYVIASIVLAIMLAARRAPLPDRRDWPRLAFVGFLGITAYNLALNYGSQFIQSGSAAFVVNTAPIFTAIFATAMLNERITPVAVGGILVGFSGTTLVLLGEGRGVAVELPALLILLGTVAFSLYFVTQKPLMRRYTALQVVSMAVWFGTLFMVPASLRVGSDLAAAPAKAVATVIFLGVFPGALAFASWSYVLSRIPVSRALTFTYCIPPLTVLIGWIWLGEIPAVLSLAGGVVALCGVVIVNTIGKREYSFRRRPKFISPHE
jgi:drug/metabolite transporter (DMT)-like permease